jgi:hypothetical protein
MAYTSKQLCVHVLLEVGFLIALRMDFGVILVPIWLILGARRAQKMAKEGPNAQPDFAIQLKSDHFYNIHTRRRKIMREIR